MSENHDHITNFNNAKSNKSRVKKRVKIAAGILALIFLISSVSSVLAPTIEFKINNFYAEDYIADVGEEIEFTWNIQGDNITSIYINWGDCSENQHFNPDDSPVTHNYDREGIYNVTIYVYNDFGDKIQRCLGIDDYHPNGQQIVIKNEAPSFDISFSKQNPFEDELVTISVVNLDDSNHDEQLGVIQYIYDTGIEQINATERFITYSWKNAGEYPVSITAIDDQGATKQIVKNINVLNKNPTAAFTLGADIPATWSFSKDLVGGIPFSWQEGVGAARDAIKVVNGKDSHAKILEITGNPGHSEPFIYNIIGDQYFGTVEYYLSTTNTTTSHGFLSLNENSNGKLSIFTESGKWKYKINSEPSIQIFNVNDPEINVWTHMRIDYVIDCSYLLEDNYFGIKNDNEFRIIIDGVLSPIYSLSGSGMNKINRIAIGTYTNNKQGKVYLDSIGTTSDPNYKVGDNYDQFKSQYYATHDWRFDVVGKEPKGWDVDSVDAQSTGKYSGSWSFDGANPFSGWTTDADSYCYIERYNNYKGHENYVEMWDGYLSGNYYMRRSDLNKTSGSWEFWYAVTKGDHDHYLSFTNAINGGGIWLQIDDYMLFYLSGTVWKEAIYLGYYKWYRIRVDFECGSGNYMGLSSNTYDLYVNDYLIVKGVSFSQNTDYLTRIEFATENFGCGYGAFLDAIGVTGVNDYELGDNKYSPCDIKVVDVGGDYREVVRLSDRSTEEALSMAELLEQNQTSGIIQWYVKSSDVNEKTWALILLDNAIVELSICTYNGRWQYSTRGFFSNFSEFCVPQNNQWYPLSLEFNGATRKFRLTVNETQSSWKDLSVSFDKVSEVKIESGISATGVVLIDALGYSFDNLYNVDDYKLSLVSYPEKSYVQFNAADSSDTASDSSSLKYYWKVQKVGTGSNQIITGYGENWVHDFKQSGLYNASLAVKDNNGGVGSCSKLILIHNRYPEIEIIADQENITLYEGQTLVINTEGEDDLTDWAELFYIYDFNSTQFSLEEENCELSGWKATHLYTDDFSGSIGARATDPEGASSEDYTSLTVLNVDPLLSVYDASAVANISFEAYRNSVSKEANFTFSLTANELSVLSQELSFEGSEENSISSDFEEIDLTLCKNWNIVVNSTTLPSNSWFRYYVILRFLDGQQLTLISDKVYGTGSNFGPWSAFLNPYFYDNSEFSFKYPLTFKTAIFDPSVDDLNLTVSYVVNAIVEISCGNDLPISDSFTIQKSLGNANYVVKIYSENGVIFANITATQSSIYVKSFEDNSFPAKIKYNFTIFPIVDLYEILQDEMGLTQLSVIECIFADNYIIVEAWDDDGGQGELTIIYTTEDGVEFVNLSPEIDSLIPENVSTTREIKFYAIVSDFDEICEVEEDDYCTSNFKEEDVIDLPNDIEIISGSLNEIGDLEVCDTSRGTFYSSDNSVMPDNLGDFTISNGTLLNFGNLKTIDGNYTSFKSNQYYSDHPATYTFTDDTIGSNPAEFTVSEPSGTTVQVISEIDGHKNVVEFYDGIDWGKASIENTFSDRTSGTVEWWARISSAKAADMFLCDGPVTDNKFTYLYFAADDYIKYYDGTNYNLMSYAANTWYHFKVNFTVGSSDKWSIWINDVLKGSNLNFYGNPSAIDRMYFSTYTTRYSYYFYVDACDYNWSSGYLEGRNKNSITIPAVVNISTELQFNGPSNALSLLYSYKCNTTQSVNFKVWNYDSLKYDLISSNAPTSFSEQIFALNNSHYNANYAVKLNFYASNNITNFKFYIEKLKINLGNNTLHFIAGFEMSKEEGETIKFMRLYYGYLTDYILQQINLSIYNFIDERWELIDSKVILGEQYQNRYAILTSKYYNSSSLKVLLKLDAVNNTKDFEFYLDQLTLEYYSSVVSKEKLCENSSVPVQPEDFTLFNGALSDWAGNLEECDNNYTKFFSNNYIVSFESSIDLEACQEGDKIDDLALLYGLKTNATQIVTLYLYNYTSSSWCKIDDGIYLSFATKSYAIPVIRYEQVNISQNCTQIVEYCDFYSSNFTVKIKIEAINDSYCFKLFLDLFKINYNFTHYYFISNNTRDSEILNNLVSFDAYETYGGSCSFETDADGTQPAGWTVYYPSYGDSTVQVFNEVLGHKKVLYLFDNCYYDSIAISKYFDQNVEKGIVSFWWACNHEEKESKFMVRGNGENTVAVSVLMGNGVFQYRDGSEWYFSSKSYAPYVWYFHKIVFDCENSTYDWYINGQLAVDNAAFYHTVDYATRININTMASTSYYRVYFDGFKFSWDVDSALYNNTEEITVVDKTFDLELKDMNWHRFYLFDACKINYAINASINGQNVNLYAYNFKNSTWTKLTNFIVPNSAFLESYTNFRNTDFIQFQNDSYWIKIKLRAENETINSFKLGVDQLTASYIWNKVHSAFGYDDKSAGCYYYEEKSTEYKYWYYGNHTFDYEGEYLIILSADDGYSTTKTGEVIEIVQPKPYLRILPFPNETYEDAIIDIEAEIFSSGAFANETRYLWNFGDGYYEYELKTSHAWATSGTYSITLFVKNCFGNTYSDVATIVVKEKPPEIKGPFTFYGVEGKAVILDIEVCDSNVDEIGLQYRWFNEENELIFNYNKPSIVLDDGEYLYRLEVEDANGHISTSNISIIVENAPPIVLVSNYAYYGAPGEGAHGEPGIGQLSLRAYAYDSYYDMNDMKFNWTIYSGNESYSIYTGSAYYSSISYKCKETRIYSGIVTVTDPSGATAIASFGISSFIDSNSNGLSDEFEAQLALYNKTYELYEDPDVDGLINEYEWGITNTSYKNPDTDGDYLYDGIDKSIGIGELSLGTDPRKNDTDFDTLLDSFEFYGWKITTEAYGNISVSSNPCKFDTDFDGFNDYQEYIVQTDPRSPDTDKDGLLDGIDPHPTKYDGDGDILNDKLEIELGTDPNNTDTDQDGLTDGQEVLGWSFYTNPLDADSDDDFLADNAETKSYKFELAKKAKLNKPVSLWFKEHCVKPLSAQIAFTIAFGEYARNDTLSVEYGVKTVPSLEIEIIKAENNLIVFNTTTNGTEARYISQVVDLKQFIEKYNGSEVNIDAQSFDYFGEYILRINDTKADCLLEQFEIEISKYLDPNDPDYDNDGIMDGVESGGLVRANSKIDFKSTYYSEERSYSEPQAWWTLDNPSKGYGVIEDFSGNGFHSIFTNIDYEDWVEGKVGPYALSFDGNSEYVDFGTILEDASEGALGDYSQEFTITIWLNPSDLSNTSTTNHGTKNCFLAKTSDSSNDNFETGINSDGTIHIYLNTESHDTSTDFGNTGDIQAGLWNFVVIKYNFGNLSVQINDNLYISSIWQSGNTDLDSAAGSQFTIGCSDHINTYYEGLIDDVRVYNRALNDENIAWIYNNCTGRTLDPIASGSPLTIGNSTDDFWNEFQIEVPRVGKVYDANLYLKIDSEETPWGNISVIGTVSVQLIKDELNYSLQDITLINESPSVYDGWDFSREYLLNLSAYVRNNTISELYGKYLLKVKIINSNFYEHYNFTVSEFCIETDTWRAPLGLEDSKGWVTDPAKADTDGDGWNDYYEIFGKETNPCSADTDGDGAWDPNDRDPLRDLIVQIKFDNGKFNHDMDTKHAPKLQGVVEFEVCNQEFYFTTEAVKATSNDNNYDVPQRAWFGHKYYFNVEDDVKIQGNWINLEFELWWMWPVDEDGNHLGDKKLLADDCDYYIGTTGTQKIKEFENWCGNKLAVQMDTIAIEKCNTIAIFEANSMFNGHYLEQERTNVIQLYVTDGTGPFKSGPNAIVIPTSLFTKTKLNSYLQKEQLSETPLYSPDGNFQFISADRDEGANADGSTNKVDFVIIRKDISGADAMAVLDLLLTCLANESLDENNQTIYQEAKLYAFVSTLQNGTKATSMNLAPEVLKYVSWYNIHVNSPQGKHPTSKSNVATPTEILANFWKDICEGKVIDAFVNAYNSFMLYFNLNPSIGQILAAIIAIANFLIMIVLTILGPLLWLLILVALLILIWIDFAKTFAFLYPLFLGLSTVFTIFSCFNEGEMILKPTLFYLQTEVIIVMIEFLFCMKEYNLYINKLFNKIIEIPTIDLHFKLNQMDLNIRYNFFIGLEFPSLDYVMGELFNQISFLNEHDSNSNINSNISLKSSENSEPDENEWDWEEFLDGLSLSLGIFSCVSLVVGVISDLMSHEPVKWATKILSMISGVLTCIIFFTKDTSFKSRAFMTGFIVGPWLGYFIVLIISMIIGRITGGIKEEQNQPITDMLTTGGSILTAIAILLKVKDILIKSQFEDEKAEFEYKAFKLILSFIALVATGAKMGIDDDKEREHELNILQCGAMVSSIIGLIFYGLMLKENN